MSKLIIEICPREPRASACLTSGDEVTADPEVCAHLDDCTRPGDCAGACHFVLSHVGVDFRTVACNAAGEYENRVATADEKAATCRAIYFDSEADFSDESTAEMYLVWQAANEG